jgi:hypothetical protein
MALLERLQILVDGNAQGAIREFQKVGAAADRELGRTEDKLNKISASLTSFGTGLIAGGAVAIAGLKTLADSASAYGEQVSAATVTFGEQGAAQLEKFAEAAADTANISKTEATKAANGFATFARQAGLSGTAAVNFSTDLVQLAGDISSFRDISVADALAALQSGLAGEGEPIRRLGGDISDVALKAEYLALTGEEVTGSLTAQQKIVAINSKLFKDFELAQGDVIRTQDSLANQTRNAQANFENLKTELGERLTPVFATVVGGINDIITKFSELPEGLKGPLAALAGIGAFGAVAVGGLSLVAGQALKFRDAFTTTTTTVVDGVETQRRSINKLGQAAKVFGGLVTALAVAEGIFQAVNAGTNAVGKFETALDRVAVASTEGGAAIGEAFAAAAGEQDKILEFQNVWTDFGARVILTASGTKGSIEDVQQTFDALSKTDPKFAALVLDQLQIVTNGLDRNSDQWATNQRFIDDNREALNLAAGAAQVTGGELEGLETQLGNTEVPASELLFTVEGLAVKTDEAKNAFQAYSDVLKANTDPFFAVIDAAGGLADAQAKVAEAYIALFTDGATAQEFVDLADAQRDAVGAAVGLESTIAALRGEVEAGNIEYGTAIETLDVLAEKYPQLAPSIGQVKDEFFFAALAAQGLKDTAPIDLSITANVQPVLDGLVRLSGGLFAVKSQADIAADAVINLFGGVFAGKAGQKQQVPMPNLPPAFFIPPQFRRAEGGPVAANQSYLVGEEGPEIFKPKTSGTIIPNNQLPTGEVNQTFNITSPDPILTAAEVVRRQRDAEFLAGV